MKRILAKFLCGMMSCNLFAGCNSASENGTDNRRIEVKMTYKAVQETAKILKERYQLRYVGIAESGGKDYYTLIGTRFQLFRIVSKEEGRKILVDSTEELLKNINSNPALLPHLKPSPFTDKNVQVVVFVYQKDGGDNYHPDITVLSMMEGEIEYRTKSPEKKYGYYTVEKETYEEAKKIVEGSSQAQNAGPQE
jgi:hypothetical protein